MPATHESMDAVPPEPAKAGDTGLRRRPRWRLVLLVMLAVVGVTCVGGVVVGYFLYYKATEPDRSTPGVVVDQYLQATFSDRDENRARLFTCENPDKLTEMQAMLSDIKDREKRGSKIITVHWEDFDSSITGRSATVTANLIVVTPSSAGASSRSIRKWQFTTENRSGWRVCDAHRIG